MDNEILNDPCEDITIGKFFLKFESSLKWKSIDGFRFYDELDYERRVRKRQTKLLSSCEDAFTHVRKYFQEKSGSHIPMDAREAAQVILSSFHHFVSHSYSIF